MVAVGQFTALVALVVAIVWLVTKSQSMPFKCCFKAVGVSMFGLMFMMLAAFIGIVEFGHMWLCEVLNIGYYTPLGVSQHFSTILIAGAFFCVVGWIKLLLDFEKKVKLGDS